MSWLAGTHASTDVLPRDKTDTELRRRETANAMDSTATLQLAASRLRQAYWIGLLETWDDSLARLSSKLGVPLSPRHEQPGKSYPPVSNTVRMKLEALMPMDMWLYVQQLQCIRSQHVVFARIYAYSISVKM